MTEDRAATGAGPARPDRLGDELDARLHAYVAEAQRHWRAPAVSAGVVRDGRLVWTAHIGEAELGGGAGPVRAATDDTQYLIGSITKTFTAVMVMALRDEGRLDIDGPVSDVLPEVTLALTPRLLMAHASGLQREFAGRVWQSLDFPDAARLLSEMPEVGQVLPAHVFHYSNLGVALLGQVVATLDGGTWEESVTRRILRPLGMTRTGLEPLPDAATGYLVHPHSGSAHPEPRVDIRASVASGGLWSTVADLARYAAFLADPLPEVLARETVEEMMRPVVMTDTDTWTGGYGLGFHLARTGERVLAGHGGAMPGFLSGLRVARRDHIGAVVLTNSSAGAEPLALAAKLALEVVDAQPPLSLPWSPSQPRPDLAGVLGSWWTEGEEIVFEVRGDQLWSRLPGEPGALGDTRFEKEGVSLWRAVEGRERGELLELVRDGAGAVVSMYFVTYPVTRAPLVFGG